MGVWPAAMIEMAVRKRHPSIPADWANAMALTIKGGLQIAILRTKKSKKTNRPWFQRLKDRCCWLVRPFACAQT